MARGAIWARCAHQERLARREGRRNRYQFVIINIPLPLSLFSGLLYVLERSNFGPGYF